LRELTGSWEALRRLRFPNGRRASLPSLTLLLALPEFLEFSLQMIYPPLGVPALSLLLGLLSNLPPVLEGSYALPLELFCQSPLLLPQLLEFPAEPLRFLPELHALLSLPLRFFLQGPAFLAQELQ
jgi:hypothetical protein